MKNKIVIYDPPMCCSSGLCGPNPDQTLIDLQTSITELQKTGVEVERYIITQSPEKFKENPEIIKLIQEHDLKILPVTTLSGKVTKTGSYPTKAEFATWLKVDFKADPPNKDVNCCADKNACDVNCGPSNGDCNCGSVGYC
jgi:hypothetical protein